MTDTTITLRDLGEPFEQLLAQTNEAKLVRLMHDLKIFVSGSYRPGKPAVLRDKLAIALRPTLLNPSPVVSCFIRATHKLARLFGILSEEAITQEHLTWFAYAGKANVLLALLADERESVRTLAQSWMTAAALDLPEQEDASVKIKSHFDAVVSPSNEKSPANSAQLLELRTQLKKLRDEQHAERIEARKQREELERKLKEQASNTEFGYKERDRKIETLEASAKRDAEEREHRVSNLLANRQIDLFRGWLKPYLERESMAKQSLSAPLLERVDAAIAEQDALDRPSHDVAALRTELEAVRKALQRVDGALQGALVQSPTLVALRAELFNRQCQLETQVEPAQARDLVTALKLRIIASTEDDFNTLKSLIKAMTAAGILSKEETSQLNVELYQRASLWHMSDPTILQKDESDEGTESQAIQRRNPALVSALTGQAPARIFLDGHNMLLGLGRYKRSRGVPLKHEDARKRMERDIVTMFMSLPMVVVDLVWDGEASDDFTLSDNVLGHYSGGQGEHKADHFILDQVKFCRKDNASIPCIVVTDDAGFGGSAISLGASVCKLHDFEAFFDGPAR